MPPPRDVEGEIYQQLYGHAPSGGDRPERRVIVDDASWLEIPREPEPPEARLSRLDRALDAAAASLGGLRASLRPRGLRLARPRGARARTGVAGGESRALALTALAAAILGFVALVAVGPGPGEDAPQPADGSMPPAGDRAQAAASEQAEAREARRRRAAQRRRAARRRAAERAEARRVTAQRADSQPRQVKLLCVEGGGCVPENSHAGRRLRAYEGGGSRTDGRGEGGPSRDGGSSGRVFTEQPDLGRRGGGGGESSGGGDGAGGEGDSDGGDNGGGEGAGVSHDRATVQG